MKQSWKGRSLPHETELIMNTNLPLSYYRQKVTGQSYFQVVYVFM